MNKHPLTTMNGFGYRASILCTAAILVLSSLLLNGCMERIARKTVENCEFQFIGMGIEKLDQARLNRLGQMVLMSFLTGTDMSKGDDTLNVSLLLSIKNKNSFSIVIDSLDYRFFLGDKQVATGGFASDKRLELTAGKTVQAVLPANISLYQLLLALGGFQKAEEAQYRVEGTIVLDSSFGKWDFPVYLEGTGLDLQQGFGMPSAG